MASGFLKGTLILTIAGFVVKAIGSINWILLSRILGGEGIGIYQMAWIIFNAGIFPKAAQPWTNKKLPIKPNGTESNTDKGRM